MRRHYLVSTWGITTKKQDISLDFPEEKMEQEASKQVDNKSSLGDQSGQMTVIDDVDDNSAAGSNSPEKSYSRSRSTSRSSSKSGR